MLDHQDLYKFLTYILKKDRLAGSFFVEIFGEETLRNTRKCSQKVHIHKKFFY